MRYPQSFKKTDTDETGGQHMDWNIPDTEDKWHQISLIYEILKRTMYRRRELNVGYYRLEREGWTRKSTSAFTAFLNSVLLSKVLCWGNCPFTLGGFLKSSLNVCPLPISFSLSWQLSPAKILPTLHVCLHRNLSSPEWAGNLSFYIFV